MGYCFAAQDASLRMRESVALSWKARRESDKRVCRRNGKEMEKKGGS